MSEVRYVCFREAACSCVLGFVAWQYIKILLSRLVKCVLFVYLYPVPDSTVLVDVPFCSKS